jgi:hypothetical protein
MNASLGLKRTIIRVFIGCGRKQIDTTVLMQWGMYQTTEYCQKSYVEALLVENIVARLIST